MSRLKWMWRILDLKERKQEKKVKPDRSPLLNPSSLSEILLENSKPHYCLVDYISLFPIIYSLSIFLTILSLLQSLWGREASRCCLSALTSSQSCLRDLTKGDRLLLVTWASLFPWAESKEGSGKDTTSYISKATIQSWFRSRQADGCISIRAAVQSWALQHKGSAMSSFVSPNHSPGKSSKFHLKSWGDITSDFDEICIRQNFNFIWIYIFYILKYIIFQTLPCPIHLQILGELLKQKIWIHQVYKKERRPKVFSLLCGPTTDIPISETVCRWKEAYTFLLRQVFLYLNSILTLIFFSWDLSKTGCRFLCISKIWSHT